MPELQQLIEQLVTETSVIEKPIVEKRTLL